MKRVYSLVISLMAMLSLVFAEKPSVYVFDENTARLVLSNHFANVNRFNYAYPQEKVYLHFDNSGYYCGEDIFFKAYVVLASGLQSSSLSKVLYVELIDQFGNTLETQRLKIENGQCFGNFTLKDYYKPGFYEVRAYTKIMLNNDNEVLFSRIFPIFGETNAQETNTSNIKEEKRSTQPPYLRKKREKLSKLNMNFYPEGGNSVNGCFSRFAFKACDNNGFGVSTKGFIVSSENDTVTHITTLHRGMGVFSFMPEKGIVYSAHIMYENKIYKFDLPKSIDEGYVLESSSVNKDFVNINIRRPQDMNGDTLGMAVMTSGKISYANVVDMKNFNDINISVPKSELGGGVSNILLIDRMGLIMTERLIFNRPENSVDISVKTDKNIYNPYDAINLEFKLLDKDQMPISTSFSLSVKDCDDDIQTNYSDNIYTDLLLSSEVKGYIEDVGYYFQKNDRAHIQALDLLMMVQGWRRYKWDNMVKGSPENIENFQEKGLVVSGKVESIMTHKSKKGVLLKATVSPRTEMKTTAECLTDEDGNFNFMVSDFNGSANMTLGIYDSSDKNKRLNGVIKLNQNFSPEKREITAYEMIYSKEKRDSDRARVSGNKETIKDINSGFVYNSKMEHEIERKNDNITNKKEERSLRLSSVSYDVKTECDNLINKGISPDLNLKDFVRQISPLVSTGFRYKDRDMVYVIDDRSIDESIYQNVDEIRIDDIKKIAICDDQISYLSYYPNLKSTGVTPVVVFLYTDPSMSINERKGERITTFEGYSRAKEFYVPQILSPDALEDIPYRRTLYWNPDVKSDANGTAKVNFFNTGSAKEFIVDAQTILPSGLIGIIK